jgi:hypothetical protein
LRGELERYDRVTVGKRKQASLGDVSLERGAGHADADRIVEYLEPRDHNRRSIGIRHDVRGEEEIQTALASEKHLPTSALVAGAVMKRQPLQSVMRVEVQETRLVGQGHGILEARKAAIRAQPKVAHGVFDDAEDAVSGQAVIGREAPELDLGAAGRDATQAAALCSEPNVAPAVHVQGSDGALAHAMRIRRIVAE